MAKLKSRELIERDVSLFHCHVSTSFMKLLTENAAQEYRMYEQWKRLNSPNLAFEHHVRCETLVNLLESLFMFHHGFGTGIHGGLKARLQSFEKVYDKFELDPKDFDLTKKIPHCG